MGRSSFVTGGFRPAGAPPVEVGEQEGGALPRGFWFGGGLRECWRSVYSGYSLEQLRHEETELWDERGRIAAEAPEGSDALKAILLRIALVEDRLREIVGSYS